MLLRRLEWRGIEAEVVTVSQGSPIPRGTDLLVLGGGEDDAQAGLAAELAQQLPAALADGVVLFAVCAGLQLLGHSFQTAAGTTVAGAGVLDVVTTAGRGRAVGEVVAEPVDPALPELTGFTNHGGVTLLEGRATPLAKVRSGPANHPSSGDEGAVQDRVIATYLHGPVLARNPALADQLLAMATGLALEPLPDAEVKQLRAERLRAARQGRRRRK